MKVGTMWVLVIIILSPTPGVFKTTVLEKYTTERECRSEEVRISDAMKEAYPLDDTYVIKCQLRPSETGL